MPKYQNIAAGWIKKDKNGNSYLAIQADRDIKQGEWFSLFKNDKGDNPNRPDYRAYEKLEEEPQEVPLEDEIPF